MGPTFAPKHIQLSESGLRLQTGATRIELRNALARFKDSVVSRGGVVLSHGQDPCRFVSSSLFVVL